MNYIITIIIIIIIIIINMILKLHAFDNEF